MDTHINKVPLISVVMPVYNASPYLAESMGSILNQTLSDFEFIIIDDASTDNSLSIVQGFRDERIKLFVNEQNLGVTANLNRGLELARGKYIARMDADDISLPYRFEKQVEFLEKHTDHILVGSYFQIIPTNYIVKVPVSDEEIKTALIFHNPFGHPTIMLRGETVKRYQLFYDEKLPTGQDQDLWYRMSNYGKYYNLPEVLLLYRVHDQQVSTAKVHLQKKNSEVVRIRKIVDFLGNTTPPSLEFYCKLTSTHNDETFSLSEKLLLKQWVNTIYQTNRKTHRVNPRYLRVHLANFIIKFIEKTQSFTIGNLWFYLTLFVGIKKIPWRFLVGRIFR